MVRDPRINFQMVLNWQFCTILHLAGGGWEKTVLALVQNSAIWCNMLQWLAVPWYGEVGIQITQGLPGVRDPWINFHRLQDVACGPQAWGDRGKGLKARTAAWRCWMVLKWCWTGSFELFCTWPKEEDERKLFLHVLAFVQNSAICYNMLQWVAVPWHGEVGIQIIQGWSGEKTYMVDHGDERLCQLLLNICLPKMFQSFPNHERFLFSHLCRALLIQWEISLFW